MANNFLTKQATAYLKNDYVPWNEYETKPMQINNIHDINRQNNKKKPEVIK